MSIVLQRSCIRSHSSATPAACSHGIPWNLSRLIALEVSQALGADVGAAGVGFGAAAVVGAVVATGALVVVGAGAVGGAIAGAVVRGAEAVSSESPPQPAAIRAAAETSTARFRLYPLT